MSQNQKNLTFDIDKESGEFLRNLVIAKTKIDYDLLDEGAKNDLAISTFYDCINFLDSAINEFGSQEEIKHWKMYKVSGLNPKILVNLSTLNNAISNLILKYIE